MTNPDSSHTQSASEAGPTDNLAALSAAGVSIWLDDQELIDTKHVVGVTTNPSIFQAAMADGEAYTAQLTELVQGGADLDGVVFALTTTDVRDACDLFLPVFERTHGVDGRVSIEVDPRLAHDTERTVAQPPRPACPRSRRPSPRASAST